MVAELTNGDERSRGESWEDVCSACCKWERREIECGGVGGCDGVAVRKKAGNAGFHQLFVDVWCCAGEEVSSAACVGDDGRWGWRKWWQGGSLVGRINCG